MKLITLITFFIATTAMQAQAEDGSKEAWIYTNFLRVIGSQADISCIKVIVDVCEASDDELRRKVLSAVGSKLQVTNRLPIQLIVERGSSGTNLFADYGTTPASRTLHIDHFEAVFGFQCPAIVSTASPVPPDWAPSLCSVLGRELVEAAHVFNTEATDPCAQWRSHLVGIVAENRLRGARKSDTVACRSVEPEGGTTLKHGTHFDSFVQYGNNYTVIHVGTGTNKTVEFVTGGIQRCSAKEWNWDVLERQIKYPRGLERCEKP